MRYDAQVYDGNGGWAYVRDNHKLKNWFHVTIDGDGIITGCEPETTPYILASRRNNIHSWCDNQCNSSTWVNGGWYEIGVTHYAFHKEEDAVLFALRWC